MNDIKNEIILYQPNETVKLEVRLENETVWLTQQQIASLFATSRTNIVEHIKNIYQERELDERSTCQKFRQVRLEGGRTIARSLPFYNLDVILSVGYRVKSALATKFRQWATSVLKEYAMRGYAVNQRFERVETRVSEIEKWKESIDLVVNTSLPPHEGLFFAGQIYDAFRFAREKIAAAKSEIILVDNYVDESVLTMMADKKPSVAVKIFTRPFRKAAATAAFNLAVTKFNAQYGGLTVTNFMQSHDRFLIIDRKKLYLFGASLKDLGESLFGVTEMDASNIPRIVAELGL